MTPIQSRRQTWKPKTRRCPTLCKERGNKIGKKILEKQIRQNIRQKFREVKPTLTSYSKNMTELDSFLKIINLDIIGGLEKRICSAKKISEASFSGNEI